MKRLSHLATGLVLLLTLGSCTPAPSSVTLSSGTKGGYYNRLGEQINDSSQTTANLTVTNLESQGSRQNLQRLLDRQTDFALVQLDVATDAMRAGKVEAVAILASEPLHIITQANSALRQFTDLQSQRVAIGTPGSGIRHTASHLLKVSGITVKADDTPFTDALAKLNQRQLEAVIYIGNIGASDRLRQYFATHPNLRLLPVQKSLINYLTIRDPGSYQAATIPAGSYHPRPALPPQDVPTLATATVIVTRPDVSSRQVGLLAWSILATSRKYARFYPELQTGDPKALLQQGLFFIHPAAQDVYQNGDPRSAWIRYWESNNDLQAGLVILVGTSGAGLLLRKWRRDRSKKLIDTTQHRINELKDLLPQDASQALRGIEELSQEHRLMFIDGTLPSEIYEEVRQKTQMFADQCRTLSDQQRKKSVLDTLLLLEDWQETLQTNPSEALRKLGQIKQRYREMLLDDQVDIEAYIELMELTLISLMTLTPKE